MVLIEMIAAISTIHIQGLILYKNQKMPLVVACTTVSKLILDVQSSGFS